MRSLLAPALCLATALLVSACAQRAPKPKSAGLPREDGQAEAVKAAEGDRPYYQGTLRMRQDIRDLFARVEGAPPHEWASIARKLVAYGEPAVPQMIANLDSHEKSVAVMAAYCLGMIQDPRALDALSRSALSSHEQLRYESATSMLRMGDRRGLPIMIDALEHADPLVRARAILVLKERTGGTMGYEANGKPEDRAAAVARWRAWLARGGGVMAPAGGRGR